MKIAHSITLAILIMACISLNGQEKKAPDGTLSKQKAVPARVRPPFDAKSRFPAPVQYLMKFSGKWTAKAAFVSNGKTDSIEYTLIGRSIADGNGLLLEESYTDSIRGKMRGTNLAGYDSNDAKIHWYSVDNRGTTHEHTGEWVTADSLTLDHKSVKKGKNYREKINIAFKGRDEFYFAFTSNLDGKEEKVIAVFTRVMPAKRPVNPTPDRKSTEPEKKE
jgi:hypothetical protein